MALAFHQASIDVPSVDLARQHRALFPTERVAFDRVAGTSAFIPGEDVARFENEFAAFCSVPYCVGMSSGTAALTIMLRAAGIGAGDEVVVPAHTFIASALAVIHAGATPVLADVDERSGLIDPDAVRASIDPATAAILAVHLYGQVCDIAQLRNLAERHGLALLEDAAQAHGATYRGFRTGGLGAAAAFSVYPSKNLGALGDAGAICTADRELAGRARALRDLGRDGTHVHEIPGYNDRLDGLQAALLRAKPAYVDEWNAARRSAAEWYSSRLDGVVTLLEETSDTPSTFHLFPIRVDDRGSVAEHLAARGISTGVPYPLALADQPALRGCVRESPVPVAREWAARELSLALFPGITDDELERVVERVTDAANVIDRGRDHEANFVSKTLDNRGRKCKAHADQWARRGD